MKLMLTSFIIVLLGVSMLAQTTGGGREYTQDDLNRLGNIAPYTPGVRGFDNRYEGVRGTPLLFENWQDGIISFRNDTSRSKQIPLALDVERHELYIYVKNNSIGKIPTLKVEEVLINSGKAEERKFKVYPKQLLDGSSSRALKYLEVLHEGKITLLKESTKVVLKADYKGPYSADRRYDEYKMIRAYWLTLDGKTFQKVKLKKRSLTSAMKEYAEQINKISKKHKLKLKDESSVQKLLAFLENTN